MVVEERRTGKRSDGKPETEKRLKVRRMTSYSRHLVHAMTAIVRDKLTATMLESTKIIVVRV